MQIMGKTMLNYLFVLQLETEHFKICLVSMRWIAKSVQIKQSGFDQTLSAQKQFMV